VTRRRLVRSVLVLTVLALGACVYYPTIEDVSSIRIQPANGRVVRDGNRAVFYADLNNAGRYGDVITGAETPVARRATLVGPRGSSLGRLEVSGQTLVRLERNGPHVVLSELKRALEPGEAIVVTLVFEKIGALGVAALVE